MCWSPAASVAFVAAGSAATMICIQRREPPAVWLTVAYFTLMEALQATSYPVIDQCHDPANRTLTGLSYLHVAFQPLVINAFAMHLVPHNITPVIRQRVIFVAALCTALMLVQLAPLPAFGNCIPGTAMCARDWCTVSGDWHLAWEVPLNGLYNPISERVGANLAFPSYMFAAIVLPLFYGAWRFCLFNFTFGAVLSQLLTSNPNEMPAIWCLFSVAIVLVSLSPAIRVRLLGGPPLHRI